MKIAILGNGGREHAIANQILKSNKLKNYTVYLKMLKLNLLPRM